MKRAAFALLASMIAFPAVAAEFAECRSVGGHHYYNDRISAARYVRFYGSQMILTGRSGRHDMPTLSLRCSATPDGLFCAKRTRRAIVNISTHGWKMKEMAVDRHGTEIFHIVYNCNNELVLP
jgi:hypothetical protein